MQQCIIDLLYNFFFNFIVCELLADLDIGMDVNKVEYWVDRADRQFPHHPIVFQLKEKLLTIKRPNNSTKDFEKLIKCK